MNDMVDHIEKIKTYCENKYLQVNDFQRMYGK